MLKVNKQKLLSTPLSSGEYLDTEGRPCIKCSFLEACESGIKPLRSRTYDDMVKYYNTYLSAAWSLSDAYKETSLFNSHPELASLLHKYEHSLFTIFSGNIPEEVIKREELVKNLVAELEELELVEFINEDAKQVNNPELLYQPA
jgi:hypothetical protein